MSTTTPQQVRDSLKETLRKLDQLKSTIAGMERDCSHTWGPTEYKPIEHRAYTIPGDAPGTMGVDWRGPCYVPATTEKVWSRTCTKCGKVETTQRTKKEYRAGAIAGTSSQVEIPDFGRG